MIVNTRGIVLNTIRYSDSSVIAKIYTESAGQRSFLIRTGKGRNALMKMSLLQPLNLVELSFDKDDRKGMRTPKSLERLQALNAIPFDTFKTCIALFMAEVVVRAIGEEESNPKLFSFLMNAILMLDGEKNVTSNFHLKFMIEFSSHLGFYPHKRLSNETYFDLSEGEFTNAEPIHPYVVRGESVRPFQELLDCPFEQHYNVKMPNNSRRELLQNLVDYYRLHLEGMKEITSHKVLEAVLI